VASLRGLDFDDYFRHQYPKVVRELDYIVGDTDLARDLAQEAFIRQFASWARLSRFDKPGAWVRKVALRLAFRARRKSFSTTPLDAAADITTEPVATERTMDVRNAIMQLTNTQRAAVVLFYYRDLPVAEVAHALGCKEATAKVHLHKARKRLSELLVSYGP
jgi:RNA polymerase sigma-70 factor (ECF subfamily)